MATLRRDNAELDGIEQAGAEGFPLGAWRCRKALDQIVK